MGRKLSDQCVLLQSDRGGHPRLWRWRNRQPASGGGRSILDRWGFKRSTFVLANTLREADSYAKYLSAENRDWQKGRYMPTDHENRYFVVDTAGVFLNAFIGQVREAYEALELFGPEHCRPNSFSGLDYEGKVLVLSPDVLKESYWNEGAQLWYAHDGFGCSPRAIGALHPLHLPGRRGDDPVEPCGFYRRAKG